MRKKLIALLFFCSCLFMLAINTKTYAYDNGELYDMYKNNEYMKNDYSDYENSTKYGKKYRTGVMEHRQVIEFGEGRIIAREIVRNTDNYTIGTVSSIKEKKYEQYSVTNEVMVSDKIKVGITQMYSAAINLGNIANVGTSTSKTVENEATISYKYTKSKLNSKTVELEYNLSNFPKDKRTFRFSTVGIFVEFDVKKSYTQENQLKFFSYKWVTLKNTETSNYKIAYCIDTIFTTVFNDNTFGNNDFGVFELDSAIKEYK